MSSERESRFKIKILENKKISFIEKFGGRNFVGRNLGGRILFEREHPTEILVKIILCSHSVKNKKVNQKYLMEGTGLK